MTKRLLLVTATIISIYYCFRFGYIYTAYGHGGQILGIPFALIMLITTIIFFFRKQPHGKEKTFAFGLIYFLTLAAFSITIEVIRATKENYFAFLYHEPGGYVDKIFISWLVLGTLLYLMTMRRYKKHFQS
jgi:hypothetical protein